MQDRMNERERRQALGDTTRANTVDIRHTRYHSRIHKRRSSWALIPCRDIFRWISTLRNWYHTGRGQKMKDTLQEWAKNNALTLTLILALFVIQMVWIFISVAFFGGSLSGK